MVSDRKSALQVVKKLLAADFACEESDFDKEGITFHLAKELEGARRVPLPEKFLAVVTMGRGVVISCSAERLRWAHTNLGSFAPEALFDAPAVARMEKYVARDHQTMFGPDLRYICTQDTFHPYRLSGEIEVGLIQDVSMRQPYGHNLFPNALGRRPDPQRPRSLDCSAKHDWMIIGLAAASGDSDSMWQVGIDVLRDYRNRGIGKALVSRLTEALFDVEKLPYYQTTGMANISSSRIAVSLGYRPAWVEVYSGEPRSR